MYLVGRRELHRFLVVRNHVLYPPAVSTHTLATHHPVHHVPSLVETLLTVDTLAKLCVTLHPNQRLLNVTKHTVCMYTCILQARPRGLAPWVKMVDSELVRERCPPCCEAMRVVCVGGHESQLQPCSERKQYLCVHNCGRILACGNHTCQRNCHQVIQPIGEQMVSPPHLPPPPSHAV